MPDIINIADMSKPAVLAALYNSAKAQGVGFLHFTQEDMPIDEAADLLTSTHYFDYVKGRVMKVDLETDELSTALYDRDNGAGAARQALVAAGLL